MRLRVRLACRDKSLISFDELRRAQEIFGGEHVERAETVASGLLVLSVPDGAPGHVPPRLLPAHPPERVVPALRERGMHHRRVLVHAVRDHQQRDVRKHVRVPDLPAATLVPAVPVIAVPERRRGVPAADARAMHEPEPRVRVGAVCADAAAAGRRRCPILSRRANRDVQPVRQRLTPAESFNARIRERTRGVQRSGRTYQVRPPRGRDEPSAHRERRERRRSTDSISCTILQAAASAHVAYGVSSQCRTNQRKGRPAPARAPAVAAVVAAAVASRCRTCRVRPFITSPVRLTSA